MLIRHCIQRVFAQDEARFGLKGWHRRGWCPKGFRPPWVVEDRYEWFWLYAAVEPESGDSFFLFMPQLNGDCFEIFLQEFRNHFTQHRIGIVLDGASSHRSTQIQWPDEIEPLCLPSYSPELNPTERLFEELRAALANQLFEDLEALEAAIVAQLQIYWQSPQLLAQLTGFPWWRKGNQNITTH